MSFTRVSSKFITRTFGFFCVLLAAPALAQGEASAQHFQPSIGPGNFLAIDGARISDETPFSLGVMLNYSSSPYRLACEPPICSGQETLDVVRHMYTTDITGAVMVLPRLQLGLRLPVSHVLGDEVEGNRLVAAAFGDPTLEAKWRMVGEVDSPVVLGLAAHGSAPLGHAMAEGSYIGNSSFTGGLRAIADFRFGAWGLAANVGGIFRETVEVGEAEVGSALRYGGAIAYHFSRRVRLVGESVVHQYLDEAGGQLIEADAALQFRPSIQPVTITLGGGAGFNEDFGSPVGRVILGLRFDTHTISQTFGRSAPPPEPAIRRVSTEPAEETKPEPAPVRTEPAAEQVETTTAEVAQTPAPKPAPRPQPKPEPAPAVAQAPVAPPPRPQPPPAAAASRTRNDRDIIVNTRVYFLFNSYELRADAYPKLDELARAILANPDLGTIEVAGHADNIGPDEANQFISERRAQVVADYLVGKGVPRHRLRTRGYGADRPEAENDTVQGRAKNRRIQLHTTGR